MTIRITQDLPVALGNQDSAEEPVGDAFALTLRSRMRRDDQPATPGEPARPARTKPGVHRGAGDPGQREQLVAARQVEERAAARGQAPELGRSAPSDESPTPQADVAAATPLGEVASIAPTVGPGAVEAVLAQSQVFAQVVTPSATAPLPPAPSGPGTLSGATPSQTVAVAQAAQHDAASSLASAQLTAATQLQQAVIGQALVDPAVAVSRDPQPSAFVTPTIVPSMEPPIVLPTELAVAAPTDALSPAEVGTLPTSAASTTTSTLAGAGMSAGSAAVAVASEGAPTPAAAVTPGPAPVAYGGAPMAGARPYLTSSASSGAEGATRLGDVLGVATPPESVAPNSLGAAAAPTVSVLTEPGAGGTATGDTPSGVAPTGAVPAGAAIASVGVAQPSAHDAPAEPVADVGAGAPVPLIATESAEAGSAVRTPGRVTVDLAERVNDVAAIPAQEQAPATTTSSAAPVAAARHADPPPAPTPPQAPVSTTAAAPAAAPQHAAPAAQQAGPPPAVHSQILSAMTPALQRRDGSYSVELQLDPASLGRVRVQVAIAGGEVSLHLASGDAGTRDLLRQHADQLRHQLTESGFGRSSVDVGDGSRGNAWQEGPNRHAAGAMTGGHGQGDARRGSAAGSDLSHPDDDAGELPDRVGSGRRTDGTGDAALDVRI